MIRVLKLSKDRSKPDQNDPAYLISYAHHLERQARQLETEKQMVESERLRLQREVNNLKVELERLRSPPLFMGYIVEVLDNKSAVVRSTTGPNLVVSISRQVDINELKPDTRVALNQRTFAIVNTLPPTQDPMVQKMELIERPNEKYSDIGGLEPQIQELKETVELPLLKPELFEKIGIDPPKGVLLHGAPGTGKTLLAKAVANETQAAFIRLIGSELVQKFIGEGARLVREIFEFARENAPSILFIDELDAIGSRRLDLATSGDREVQRTLMQLLSELDGFNPRGDVKVVAATNRIDILDPAMLRPGRFDRIIEIPMPNVEGRTEIFKIHSSGMTIKGDIDIDYLVQMTEGTSGADIKNICTEAGMFAIRTNKDHVVNDDFLDALKKISGEKETAARVTTGFI
ncbi:MAG: proteasome-activating nucleotidase [Candidatus Heimdallarchaeota archaeon]|nr:proteasome-activating nucleotidase [Candidatus Heimdallarchaeota archaeon]MCK4770222.1 proteasome-activating nucleotidase [Candidatus Heimdallarchaeota archaeon]